MRVMGGGGTGAAATIDMRSAVTPSTAKVASSLDRVWRALPAAYDSLKIPLTTLDATKHLIGNEGMKIRQRLGTVALSQYIDCGQAQIGPSADSYEVYLNITTTARAISPTETELSTVVESAAKPITFNQEYSRCSSKGSLETRIAALVRAQVGVAR
jgi:hypothetical protein